MCRSVDMSHATLLACAYVRNGYFSAMISLRTLPLATLLGLSLVACGDDDTTSTSSAGGGGNGGATTNVGGAGVGGTGVGGGTGGSGGAAPIDVNLHFAAMVGEEAFDCNATYTDLGLANSTTALSDFRFYVHDVRLIDGQGNDVPVTLEQDGLWQYQDLALLDFEDKTGACANGTTDTRKLVHGTAPAGDYVGVAFKLGVPDSLDHLDNGTAPSPLNLSGLFWAWTSGYKYLRVDAVPEGGAGPFLLHLGATGCTGDPSLGDTVVCSRPNIPEVRFATFNLATNVVVADYAAAVSTTDMSVDAGGAPGCMSGVDDPECATVMAELGLELSTGLPTATGSFFRKE